ncbi:MAG: hypothetical protein O2948_08085 [Proteobacteria bacterium]|nr:hypothetical protein [Pseudomonadota bacterium]MDA0929044.1 hypothetical protein [Pseudomonadota bacterium]
MIGRIILTLAVIAIAYVFVRQRRLAEEAENKPVPVKKDKLRDELSQDLRMAAYMFMVLMVGIGGAVYYFRWQDEHTILTINLHRENQAQPVSYQVYKYQLQERSFTTIDGTHVTVAGSERMEVLGLEQ